MQSKEIALYKRIKYQVADISHVIFKIGDDFYKALPLSAHAQIGINTQPYLQQLIREQRVATIRVQSNGKQFTTWLIKSKFVEMDEDGEFIAESVNNTTMIDIPMQFEVVDAHGNIWQAMLGFDFLNTYGQGLKFAKWHSRTDANLMDFSRLLIMKFNHGTSERRIICWR